MEQKSKAVEVVASELLKAHGYEKTTKQCQEQWQYIVTAFRRGGYGQFQEQLNLIHLLKPSLIASHPDNVHFSMSAVRSYQHQQVPFEDQKARVPSSPEIGDSTMIHASKKRKTGILQSTKLTSEDEVNNGSENSTSENIASFVQINVPNSNSLMKHHVQISTSDLKNNERQVLHCTENNLDISVGRKNRHNVFRNLKRSPCISRQKSSKGRGNIKRVNSSPANNKSADAEPSLEKTDYIRSPKDKVQVEVLSIRENESAKLIECRTSPGITPAKTIKLHYPADHPLPPGVRHLYIPQAMVHPDTVPLPGMGPLSKSSHTSVKSDICSIPLSSKVLSLSNSRHELDLEGGEQSEDNKGISDSSSVTTDTNVSPEKETVLELLSQYSRHCQQGKQRLHNIIQESDQQHISALKEILSVFKELKESV